MEPVIIEVAVNGATRPSEQRHVPITPEQIATDGVACVDAGASIVHQHDDLRTVRAAGGGPEAMGAVAMSSYAGLLSERPDTIVYPTANFLGSTIDERWDHHRVLAAAMPAAGLGPLRMGLVDPGSVSLGSYVYGFGPSDVAYKWNSCRELGLGASIACFSPAYVDAVLAEHSRRGLPPGSLVKFYLSPDFGLAPTRESLDHYIGMLASAGLPWAVAVLGGDVVGSGIAEMAIERGGHVRVGLEDFRDPTGRQPTNAGLVAEVAELAQASSRGVATPADTARVLGLPHP